jgi:hypothetical protein
MDSKTGENRNEEAVRLMFERDSISPSPSVRAMAIWNILNQRKSRPTLWDLICFCIETISASVVDYPFLAPLIKKLNQQIYAIHYHSERVFESFVDINGREKE